MRLNAESLKRTKGAFWEHRSLDQFNKGNPHWAVGSRFPHHGEDSFMVCNRFELNSQTFLHLCSNGSVYLTLLIVVWCMRAPHRELMDWFWLMCSGTRCLFVHIFLKSLCEDSDSRRWWTSGLQLGQCRRGNAKGKISWCQNTVLVPQ